MHGQPAPAARHGQAPRARARDSGSDLHTKIPSRALQQPELCTRGHSSSHGLSHELSLLAMVSYSDSGKTLNLKASGLCPILSSGRTVPLPTGSPRAIIIVEGIRVRPLQLLQVQILVHVVRSRAP